MQRVILASIFGLSACASSVQANNCPNPAYPCAVEEPFAFLGDGDAAEQAISVAREAAGRFKFLFGRDAAPTVIVPGGTVPDDLSEALKANGYSVVFPWLSDSDKQTLRRASIRSQIEKQLEGYPGPIRQAAMEQALASLGAGKSGEGKELVDGVLAHELSHLWFMRAFPANDQPQTGHAYGGWATDWLDEAAAIALENADMKAKRRAAFKAMPVKRRFELSEFLSMEHPSAKAARALGEHAEAQTGERGSSRAIILTGEDANKFLAASGRDRARDFYAQTLVFTDFLETRTGSNRIIAMIAMALADGQSFEEWLESGVNGLPASLSTLEADWDDYLDSL